MHTFYLRIAGFWLVAALALASNPVWAAQKNAVVAPPPKAGSIVKWVDEKGVTHYGDTMPPERSGHAHSELDRQGHEVKRNKAEDSQANKAEVEEPKLSVEQQRHDSTLLAAYTTEQEFDLARDRNLETDQAAVEGLNQRTASAKERLAVTQKTADGFKQRKKPVPDFVAQDLKEGQDEIAKIETQIVERQKSMDATRQRFEKDKQRFIELKRGPSAPPPVAARAPAPVPENAEGAAEPAPAAPITPTAATKPVATTAPMAAPKAPAAKLAPTPPPAPAPEKPAAATPVQPVAPVATKPISPAEKTATATPAPAAPATKPAKKIKRVVMP